VERLHEVRCPECDVELCADPQCTFHHVDEWASVHAEAHPIVMAAVLLYEEVRKADVFGVCKTTIRR
jgi:hypothetical protein